MRFRDAQHLVDAIQTRNEMLATGVRSAVGVKVYGPDCHDRAIGIGIESALKGVRGTEPPTPTA